MQIQGAYRTFQERMAYMALNKQINALQVKP